MTSGAKPAVRIPARENFGNAPSPRVSSDLGRCRRRIAARFQQVTHDDGEGLDGEVPRQIAGPERAVHGNVRKPMLQLLSRYGREIPLGCLSFALFHPQSGDQIEILLWTNTVALAQKQSHEVPNQLQVRRSPYVALIVGSASCRHAFNEFRLIASIFGRSRPSTNHQRTPISSFFTIRV